MLIVDVVVVHKSVARHSIIADGVLAAGITRCIGHRILRAFASRGAIEVGLGAAVAAIVRAVAMQAVVQRPGGAARIRAAVFSMGIKFVGVENSEEGLIFHIRKHQGGPREAAVEHGDGQHVAALVLMILAGQRHFAQIICATRTVGSLAGRLDGRQKHCGQHADDGNHHQQFDQRKTSIRFDTWKSPLRGKEKWLTRQ